MYTQPLGRDVAWLPAKEEVYNGLHGYLGSLARLPGQVKLKTMLSSLYMAANLLLCPGRAVEQAPWLMQPVD